MQAQFTLSSVTQMTCMAHHPATVRVAGTQSLLADWQRIVAQ